MADNPSRESIIKFFNPKDKKTNQQQKLLQMSHEYVYLEPNNKSLTVRAPHSHWFAEIFFISNGTGKFFINGHEYLVKKGDMVFINPNITHTELNEENLTYYCLSIFNTHFEITEDTCVLPTGANDQKFTDILDNMLNEFLDQKESYEDFIFNYFEHFCLLVKRLFSFSLSSNVSFSTTKSSEGTAKNYGPVEIARGYIENNLYYDISLDYLAQLSFVSQQHLIRLFKDATGYTPIQYLHRLRITRSMYLLMRRKDSIAFIATQMGFKSSYAYIKMFKKTTGYTPQQFRNVYNHNFEEANRILDAVSAIQK